jgi:hypothetical protein
MAAGCDGGGEAMRRRPTRWEIEREHRRGGEVWRGEGGDR